MATSVSEVIFRIIADATGLKKEAKEAEKQLRSLSDVNFNSLQRRINQLKMALRSGWDIDGIDNLKRELNSLEKEFEQTGRISGQTMHAIRQELNTTSLSMVAFAATSTRSLKQVEDAIRDLNRELSRLDAGLKFAEVQAAIAALKEELRDSWGNNGSLELQNLQQSLVDVQDEFEQTGHVSITSLRTMREEINDSTASLGEFGQVGSMSLRRVEESVEDLEQELTELAAESVVEMGTLESAIGGVNNELHDMDNPDALSGANDSIQAADDSLENLQISIFQAREAFQQLDASTRVTDDNGRFYSLSFKRLEDALLTVQSEFRETGEVGEESFQTFNREVAKARAALSQLGDADGVAQLAAAIDEAEVHIQSFGRNSGLPEFRNEVTETTSAMDRLRSVVLDASIVGRALKMSLVGLVPALVPSLATTTTAVMGLGSSFLSAGAGAAGFAAVAVGNFMKLAQTMEDIDKAQKKVDSATDPKKKKEALEQLNAIYAALSNEQRKAIDELEEFKGFFFEFSQSFEKPVFSALFSSLEFLKSLLQNLKPAISSAADGISTILDLLNKSLDTSSWQDFFNFVGKTAGPSLVAWGKAIGNLLTGVINLFMAFSPIAKDMENGLVGITQRFAQWSEGLKKSNGFQSFLDYSLRNGPNFIALLKNLGSIIVSTTVALAPIGEIMLAVLKHVTDVIATLLEGVAAFTQWAGFIPLLAGLTAAFITLKAGMTFTSIAPYILALFNPMTRAMVLTQLWTKAQMLLNTSILANPYVAIAALIIGIGVALYTAYQRSETFRNGVNNAIQAVKNVVQSVVTFIVSLTSGMWDKAMSSTATFRAALGQQLGTIGQIIASGFQAAISNTSSFFVNIGKNIGSLLGQGLGSSGQAIARGFQTAISAAASFFINIGSGIASFFGQGLKNSVGGVVSGFLAQLKVGFSSLGGVLSLIAPLITGIILSLTGVSGPIGLVIGGIVSLIGFLYRLSKTNEDVRNAFSAAWQGIQSAFATVVAALQPIIQIFKDSFAQMATELGPEFQKTFQILSQSFQQLKPAFSELGSTFGQLLTMLGQTFSQLATQMQPVISQLVGSFTSMIPVIFPIIQQLISLWVQVQQTMISSVLNIATTILPMLANAVAQILPVILQAVQSVLPVVISLFQSLIPVILQLVTSVIPLILSVVTTVFPIVLQIVQAVLPVIISLIQTLIPIIMTLVTSVIPLILQVVTAVFPLVLQIIQAVLPIIVMLIGSVATIISTLAKTLIPLILSAVTAVFPVILAIIQSVIPIVVGILQMAVQVITGLLIPAIKYILSIVQIVFPAIMTLIRNAITIITNIIKVWISVFKGDWSGAWNAAKTILSTVWNSIITVIRTAVSIVLSSIKTAWTMVKNTTTTIFSAVWSFLKTTFGGIYSSVSGYVSRIWQNIVNGWNTAKNKTVEIFNSIKTKITSIFTDIVEGAKKLPGRIGDGIRAMAGGVKSGIKSFANTLVGAMGKGLNGAINGVNWVLDKVGVKTKIKTWPIPEYATGTGDKPHPGGPALVGDGKQKEYIIDGDGTHMMSPAKDTLVNLKPGARVFSGKQTKQLLKTGIPAYEGGNVTGLFKKATKGTKKLAVAAKDKALEVGKAAKDKTTAAASKAKDFALDIWEYASNPSELMKKVFAKFIPDQPKLSGPSSDILKGGIKKAKDSTIDFVKKKLESSMFGSGGPAPNIKGGAAAWRPMILKAAAAMKEAITPAQVNGIIAQIQRESGGNQRIVQSSAVWDVNTAAGNPARGLKNSSH